MRETLPSLESDSRQEINSFLSSFEGVSVKNSDGKEIFLKLSSVEAVTPPGIPELQEDQTEAWYVEFDHYAGQEDRENGNYVGLVIDEAQKNIYLSYARMSSEDLLGKNIYPQIISFIGSHFPKGFTLQARIEHQKTKEMALKLFNRFENGAVTDEELKTELLKSGMLKTTTNAGFNEFIVTLTNDGEIDVVSRKNQDSNIVAITAAIEPLENED